MPAPLPGCVYEQVVGRAADLKRVSPTSVFRQSYSLKKAALLSWDPVKGGSHGH